MLRGDQVAVLGVSLDECGDERADGDDHQSLPGGVVEGGRSQEAAKAPTLASGGDLGVGERDPVLPLPVGQQPDPSPVEKELVPVCGRDVDDGRVVGGCLRFGRFEVAGAVEVPEQLSGRIRLTRVLVIGVASSMSGGEPQGLPRRQVGEDLAGAAEDLPVLCLQDGDLVSAGHLAQVLSLLRPGVPPGA